LKSSEFNILNRSRAFAGAALLAFSVTACNRPAPPPPAPPRDLILVTIDTLRADRVSSAGGPPGLTTALDGVGRTGALFLDATAHAPLTLPSHASILTGRYPPHHGVHDNAGFAVEAGIPTLATLLHGAGYHTAAFVSSYVLRGSTGLARGFDTYDDRFEGAGRSHVTFSSLERHGPEVGRLAAEWLVRAKRPFLLWVHFYDPHAPYDPPPAFAARFPGRPYDGEIAAADFGLATLLAAVPSDRRRDTVIIVTGDHGESLGEHGEEEHGVLLYDATLHVPLVIGGGGIPPGVVVRDQVRHVDLLPTALELVGVASPAGVDGESLVPLIMRNRDAASAGRPTGAPRLSYAESRFGELHFGWSPIRSLRDGAWKYIDAPAPELYDLAKDVGERDNRRAQRPDTAAALSRALAGIASKDDKQSATRDAAAAERLRSLGYVSGRVTLDDRVPGQAPDPKLEIHRYVAYVSKFNDALAALETGRIREAEAGFRELARSFPRAFEAHQYLARALEARGDYAAAARELDAAIALSPEEAVLYFDDGRVLAQEKQFDAAFERVAEGLRREPSSFYGWLARGEVARAAGRDAAAEQAYREALTLNPGLGVAHFELGRIAEARGQREAAAAEYRLAVAADSTLTDAREALNRVQR